MYEIKSDTIPWTKFRLLVMDDFKLEPPQISKIGTEKITANTVCSIDPRILPTPCSETEYIINYEIFALFHCSKSFLRKYLGEDNPHHKILRHEQGHFDICEEHCRHLRKKLELEIKGKKFLFEGDTEKEKKLNADKNAKIIFDLAITENVKCKKTGELYDEETHHGVNRDKQTKYDERFDKLRE
ncbi:MAG: hypothetical protein IIA83_10910 [Thaumarchaeota archaeon]|nr:hypothetical protein [Nitrososphaerota archaeon]